MTGARLSRSVPPVVKQRVMTKLATRPGVVGIVYPEDCSAVVVFAGGRPHDTARIPFSQLYDATGLIAFDDAVDVLRRGGKLQYVIPGSVALLVASLYVENGNRIAEVGGRFGATRVIVKPLAPRFLEVSDAGV